MGDGDETHRHRSINARKDSGKLTAVRMLTVRPTPMGDHNNNVPGTATSASARGSKHSPKVQDKENLPPMTPWSRTPEYRRQYQAKYRANKTPNQKSLTSVSQSYSNSDALEVQKAKKANCMQECRRRKKEEEALMLEKQRSQGSVVTFGNQAALIEDSSQHGSTMALSSLVSGQCAASNCNSQRHPNGEYLDLPCNVADILDLTVNQDEEFKNTTVTTVSTATVTADMHSAANATQRQEVERAKKARYMREYRKRKRVEMCQWVLSVIMLVQVDQQKKIREGNKI